MFRRAFLLLLLSATLLGGCASYKAKALSDLSTLRIQESPDFEGVRCVAKTLSKKEIKQVLDRDVTKKGFRPVQVYMENNSDKTYVFSLNRVSLPVVSPEEVSEKMHTSTVGRAVGYGAAALLVNPLFAIPAVIDGVRSSRANDDLDYDYYTKAAKDQLIYPYSHTNMILFVPEESFSEFFTITLLDHASNTPLKITAFAG